MRFCVNTFPLISFKSSFNVVISDFLIFSPLNLNFESLGCSFKLIVKKIVFSTIFSIVISTSENNPCFQSFVIANVILSPGILIDSPTTNPVIDINVLLFRLLAPVTMIPPIS